MAKGKSKSGKEAVGSDKDAVLNLTIDSSTPEDPREVAPAGPAFETPCTLTGVMAGLSGGSLGFVFGFGGYWIRSLRGGGKWKASLAEGWGSAQTFAVMGGLYAAVNCFMQRLRQKNDAWNGAASGCATGLALGYKQGPMSALQSCAMLGIFSYVVDGMGGGEAHAAAAAAAGTSGGGVDAVASSSGSSSSGSSSSGKQQFEQQREALSRFLAPAAPLLAAVAPCVFAVELGSGAPAGGCRVLRRR